jgi:hypothetical protein
MERKCTKGQKELRTHEKTRENNTKSTPKVDKNKMEKEEVWRLGSKECVLKPVGYPSIRIT